jgi:hypothetical protein
MHSHFLNSDALSLYVSWADSETYFLSWKEEE